jgi:hypothetical protein
MAQHGSAYNTHNRHKDNHVKIGNWVEERALIETAPAMCVPVRTFSCPSMTHRSTSSAGGFATAPLLALCGRDPSHCRCPSPRPPNAHIRALPLSIAACEEPAAVRRESR